MLESETTTNIWIKPIAGLFSRLEKLGREKTFQPGEVLFYQESTINEIYAIKTGLVELSSAYLTGKRKIFAYCTDGVILGEMALFHPYENINEAVALEKSQIIVIDIEKLKNEFFRDKELVIFLFNSLSEKMKVTTKHLRIMMLDSITARIAYVLLDFHREEVRLTHDDIAALVKCSRISVTRHIKELVGEGIINSGRGKIVINDRQALAELISNEWR
jgi:CRP/FNR family cyclic AMP-dependent transcriptional regulator